eukprot:CAMPEP_0180136992 /NCGR_PEP_ID=MMETSP0986-20121125/11895_1 /TAXON_ID=697907 /ORGANISM="non described non described, Strain CCMP2293" /LENGTH=176 /DNA_ID=CAMNT_0022078265 /DNA_START=23 /DNA_END=553 /DNA_ORIENTATION=-
MTMRGALIAAVLLCGLLEAGSERPVHQLGPRQGAEGGATGGTTALLRQLASQPGGSQLRLRGGIMVYGQEADGNGGLHKNKPSGPKAPKAPKEEGANAPGKEVPHDLKIAIMKARQAKGLSQKDLANSMNMQAQEVQNIENGRTAPTNALIARMDRVLGVRLPRITKPKPGAEGAG